MYVFNYEEQKMYSCAPCPDDKETIVNELLMYSITGLVELGYKVLDIQMADPADEHPKIKITFDVPPQDEAPKGFRWSYNSLISTSIAFDKYNDCTYDICASIYNLNA